MPVVLYDRLYEKDSGKLRCELVRIRHPVGTVIHDGCLTNQMTTKALYNNKQREVNTQHE